MIAASLLLLLLQGAEHGIDSVTEMSPPDVLTYSVPDRKKGVTLEDYDFTAFSEGAKLYVAEPDVSLLAKPEAASEILAALPPGAQVEVLQASEAVVRYQDRVNRWYRVKVLDPAREGFIFGAHLTPFAFRANLDTDGDKELVTISFTPTFKVRVRVVDPGTPPRTQHVDLEPAGQGYLTQKGGNATGSLIDAAHAGLPLIKVDSLPEACADYSTTYLSYDGTLRTALALTGVADPPVHSSFEVRFDPTDRTAEVVRVNEEEYEEGHPHIEKETTRYRLRGGVFVPAP